MHMQERRRIPYVLLDVFTDTPLEGNQLAVIPDARGLSDGQLQAIARETNLSETTFIFPTDAAEPGAATHVRIFTTQEELPFAGHPTLGTAYYLHRFGGSPEVWLDLRVGKIPVRFRPEPDANHAFGEMRQKDPTAGAVHSRDDLARLTGLSVNELEPELPIQTFSTGMPFTIVPVRSLAAIRRVRSWNAEYADYLSRSDGKFFYFVTRETVDEKATLHARMPFYGGDDPATGSAAGCCASWMAMHNVIGSNEQAVIEQGLEVHRPSRIFVRAEKSGDRVINVHVGGYCVEVARGEFWI
jgi:trans-2,3-dihydro-3-hydroxyanthranilate isomerase